MKRTIRCRQLPSWKSGLRLVALLVLALGTGVLANDQKPATNLEETAISQQPQQPAANVASSATFQLSRLSINGGGDINASSASYRLGLSIGQSVAGTASSASYQMGIGFWYGAGGGCANARGDMNGDGIYTAADVVMVLNCAFLDFGNCEICFTDVNCDGIKTASDVVLELNKVFLGLTNPPWCGP